jgi:hypothetical protein
VSIYVQSAIRQRQTNDLENLDLVVLCVDLQAELNIFMRIHHGKIKTNEFIPVKN